MSIPLSTIINASLLLSAQSRLAPTHTVVRSIPIIDNGCLEDIEADGESSSETEPPPRRQIPFPNLHDLLQSKRQNLKPTETVIKSIPTVFTHEITVEEKPAIGTSLCCSWEEMHGFNGNPEWSAPAMTKHCEIEARPGYNSKLAHEYEDQPEVLLAKVSTLASLMCQSKKCLIYSGAGLSTSSGINDYATRARDVTEDTDTATTRPRLRSPLQAQPTLAHRALVEMYKANLVNYWVQQNHDGLPQKAGLPQFAINEIHGAWFDPSNPVVAMNGSLRSDLFEDMLRWEQRADLTLSLGTSMCGMNSDRCFTTPAKKSFDAWTETCHNRFDNCSHTGSDIGSYSTTGSTCTTLGGVIISVQQTQFDSLSCLRIFAPIDKVMQLLLKELDLSLPVPVSLSLSLSLSLPTSTNDPLPLLQPPTGPTPLYSKYQPNITRGATEEEDVFLIPYDRKGRRVNGHGHSHSNGNNNDYTGRHSNNIGNNCAGASYSASNDNTTEAEVEDRHTIPYTKLDLRVGSKVKLSQGPYAGDEGEVIGKNLEGHYRIQFMHCLSKKTQVRRAFESLLGLWFIEAAVQGTLPQLPVYNV